MTEPPGSRDWIGYRVARWRDLAGLTQRELAERIGVSREYISMIESGKRPVSTRRLLNELCQALGVHVEDLTMQPVAPRNTDEMVLYAMAPHVRRALDGEEPHSGQPRSLAQLAADADRAMSLRMTAGWEELAELLPALIVETVGLDSDEGRLLFCRALYSAALVCRSTGHLDLARRCADRAVAVAAQVGEPVHVAAVGFALAQAALAGGSPKLSLATAERTAERLQTSGAQGDDVVSIAGMLHLGGALAAASLGRTDRASEHLGEAAELATQAAGDPWRCEFGTANVGAWRVAVACESADWGRAPELAAAVDTTQFRTADRVSRLHVDAARGWYELGEAPKATRELLIAMETSPRGTRVLPCVREVTAQLARDAGRRGSAELQRLVSWVGVDPLAE